MDDIARIHRRPGMYVGATDDGTGLHNLVLGQIAEAVALVLAGTAQAIDVILRSDFAVAVSCTGSPLLDQEELLSDMRSRRIASESLAESALYSAWDKVDGGVFCDLCAINALSDWMCHQVWNGPSVYSLMFRGGTFDAMMTADTPPAMSGKSEAGASVTFLPSRKFFSSLDFDAVRLAVAIDDLSQCNGQVAITLTDYRPAS